MFAGDEWKVMGLAAYGKPKFYDFFREKVLTTNGSGDFKFNVQVLDHHLAKHYQFPRRSHENSGRHVRSEAELTEHHWDIAVLCAQKALEDTALYLVAKIHEMTGERTSAWQAALPSTR
jgi:carbamoyltransferase